MDYGCSSEIPVADPRQEFWTSQRGERGFDNTELWNLDVTIARFVLPRLKAFAADLHGCPASLTLETWGTSLAKMIVSFELCSAVDFMTAEQEQLISDGLDLFRKYFHHLCN